MSTLEKAIEIAVSAHKGQKERQRRLRQIYKQSCSEPKRRASQNERFA